MTKRAFALALALTAVAATAAAEPNKELYELQERCGRRAGEFFTAGRYGNGNTTTPDGGRLLAAFENHYNQKLNKCFIILKTTQYFKSEKGNDFYIYDMLIDINDNKIIGEFMIGRGNPKPDGCAVAERDCASEASWRAMVKPYMEE